MIYLAIGCVVLALLMWGKRAAPILKRREMRIAGGAMSAIALTAAAFVGLRGGWPQAVGLLVLGLVTAVAARGPQIMPPKRGATGLAEAEARAVLGVSEDATPEEIQAAYMRLMRMAHPDRGGTSGLAAQLNAARDRLLGR